MVLSVDEAETIIQHLKAYIYLLGSGIFVLSGQGAAQYAGPSIIISFIIAGIIVFLSALSMSEMSSLMSSSGSAYTYTYVGECLIFSFFFSSKSIFILHCVF